MRRVRLSIALLLAFTCGVAATLAAKKPFDPAVYKQKQRRRGST